MNISSQKDLLRKKTMATQFFYSNWVSDSFIGGLSDDHK